MQADDINGAVFNRLFKEACEKCFGFPVHAALSESDCKLFSSKIQDQTGLVIGPKSLRNYSLYISGDRDTKRENPSVATLDTLARYVLNAPYTTEPERKRKESYHPYWFQYRQTFSTLEPPGRQAKKFKLRQSAVLAAVALIAVSIFCLFFIFRKSPPAQFTDSFNSATLHSFYRNGWQVRFTDKKWWNRALETPGHLTLYTLKGDNWKYLPDSLSMRNLAWRKISGDCFVTEVSLNQFVPLQNWQQAGILLSEDATFREKTLRVSLSYNDFFAGYQDDPEILLQGMYLNESNRKTKPEEFAHVPIFKIKPGQESLVKRNLSRFVLKIEKNGNNFRFLYATGPMENFAFKEAMNGNFDIQPKYIALFATQGLSEKETPIAVKFDSFSFASVPCK